MKTWVIAIVICIAALQGWAGRYALLIGQNDGGSSVQPLVYAEQDAKRMAEVLIQTGGFQSSNVQLLLDPDSSSIAESFTKINKQIGEKNSGQGDLVFVYYSGHADLQGLLLGSNHFSFETFYQTFSALNTSVRIGVFDACYSGIVTAFKGGVRGEPLIFERVQNVKGQVIIASSAANERAQESSSLKSSIFSFHLSNGLRGSADLSGDKKVTLNEAYQYAYRKTIETSALTSGEIQHPVYKFNIQGQGDIVLTSFDMKSSGLVFDKNSTGKYLVLSENYLDVFADFYKESGYEHFISLNTGRYTIIRAYQKEVGTMSLTLNDTKTRKIRDNMFSPDFLTESRIKGPPQGHESYQASGASRSLPEATFGAGSGLTLKYDRSAGDPVWDAALTLSALWYLKEHTDFNIEITGYPAGKDISILVGADYVVDRYSRTVLHTGAAAGLLYDYKRSGTDNVLPLLAVHAGLTFALGARTHFGLRIPLSMGIDRTPVYRMGLEFRVQILGR